MYRVLSDNSGYLLGIYPAIWCPMISCFASLKARGGIVLAAMVVYAEDIAKSMHLTIWEMFVHFNCRPGREILVSYHTCPQGFFLRAWRCQHFVLHLYTHGELSWIYTTISFIKQLFYSLFYLFVFRMWYRHMHNLANCVERYVSRYGTAANIVQQSYNHFCCLHRLINKCSCISLK